MKYLLLGGLAVLGLGACAQAPVMPENVSPVYSLKTVDAYPPKRAVNAEKKSAKADKPEQKFVAVVPESAAGATEQQKLVPYSQFAAKVEQQVKKSGDVVAVQEKILTKTVEALEEHKSHLEQDRLYYMHQIKTYRYSSLRPVIQGFERGLRSVELELKDLQAKLDQAKQDVATLQNLKPAKLGKNVEADKVMQLVDNGKWNLGQQLDPDQRVLYNFFQQVAREN